MSDLEIIDTSQTSLREAMEKYLRGEIPNFPFPLGRLLGFRLLEGENGRVVLDFQPERQHSNPMGTLHGGVLCDLADAAMGLAYASTLEKGESHTTLDLRINFLKPVRDSRLEAMGQVVKRGRTIGYVECDITDEAGNLVARASCTCMTLRGEMARGR